MKIELLDKKGRLANEAGQILADAKRDGREVLREDEDKKFNALHADIEALSRQIALIDSMTRKERRNPGLLDGSRRRRIAAGAGVQVQDVNKLMKQFMEMQKMMKSMAGGRMKRMLQAFKGGVPPGFPGPAPEKPFTKSPVCVESALFFGRPGRVIRPGATQLEGLFTW